MISAQSVLGFSNLYTHRYDVFITSMKGGRLVKAYSQVIQHYLWYFCIHYAMPVLEHNSLCDSKFYHKASRRIRHVPTGGMEALLSQIKHFGWFYPSSKISNELKLLPLQSAFTGRSPSQGMTSSYVLEKNR